MAVVAVVVLLVLLVAATVVEHQEAVERERRELAFEAREQAQVLTNYFARARSLTQVMARNPAFREFYELPGTRMERIRRNGSVVRETQASLAYLEELFPDSIGEACFIDRSGPENARAVKGVVESMSRLSPDETGAPFFKPTFALRPGQVHQARPYLSPDTNEWVISNSTLVPGTPSPAPSDRALRGHDRELPEGRGGDERPVRCPGRGRSHRIRHSRQSLPAARRRQAGEAGGHAFPARRCPHAPARRLTARACRPRLRRSRRDAAGQLHY